MTIPAFLLKVVAMVALVLSRRLYTQIIIVHTLEGMCGEICHLEVMTLVMMRMYGDLVPFSFMITLPFCCFLSFFTIVVSFIVQDEAFVARLRFFLRYGY
jgi:hypothetical protein